METIVKKADIEDFMIDNYGIKNVDINKYMKFLEEEVNRWANL